MLILDIPNITINPPPEGDTIKLSLSETIQVKSSCSKPPVNITLTSPGGSVYGKKITFLLIISYCISLLILRKEVSRFCFTFSSLMLPKYKKDLNL